MFHPYMRWPGEWPGEPTTFSRIAGVVAAILLGGGLVAAGVTELVRSGSVPAAVSAALFRVGVASLCWPFPRSTTTLDDTTGSDGTPAVSVTPCFTLGLIGAAAMMASTASAVVAVMSQIGADGLQDTVALTPKTLFGGIVLVALTGLFAVLLWREWRHRARRLVLSEEGITIGSSRFLAWDDIEGIKLSFVRVSIVHCGSPYAAMRGWRRPHSSTNVGHDLVIEVAAGAGADIRIDTQEYRQHPMLLLRALQRYSRSRIARRELRFPQQLTSLDRFDEWYDTKPWESPTQPEDEAATAAP